MAHSEVAQLRLQNQLLAEQPFGSPAEVVAWLGAVQAQDYRGARWAIGLRTHDAREADVESEIAERRIVRTWPMRGTLHFVPAEDVRWMLDLLAPRAIARGIGRLRQLGLDDEALALSRRLIVQELEGGRQLTRPGLYWVLSQGGVSPEGQRGIHILSRLCQEGLLCLGPIVGRQPTFALLDEWVPGAPRLSRDESLATLATRYFASHGPATIQDFAWWSGLPVGDARRGVELAGDRLVEDRIDGQAYWLSPTTPGRDGPPSDESRAMAHLLPPYDEYTVAYRERTAVVDASYGGSVADHLIRPAVAVNGIVRGSWRRDRRGDRVAVSVALPKGADESEVNAIAGAAERYGQFLGLPVVVEQAGRIPGRAQ